MGTGIVLVLLAQFPLDFSGRMALVYGLYWTDAAFFLLFTGLSAC
ncbi:hypothetical protein GALL_237990 [mine drainage metagenome]|uniref:Uncharacterized protein n=1 Tax=mine drainage metagenome TaxID=410659 RepID=A0A1J5RET5_9ZZZZ